MPLKSLIDKHLREMDEKENHWNTEIENAKKAQMIDFKEFVIEQFHKLYQEELLKKKASHKSLNLNINEQNRQPSSEYSDEFNINNIKSNKDSKKKKPKSDEKEVNSNLVDSLLIYLGKFFSNQI